MQGQQTHQQVTAAPKFLGTVILDCKHQPIAQCLPSWELQQAVLPSLQKNHEQIKQLRHLEDQPEIPVDRPSFVEQPANWDQIGCWIESDRYKPESREEWSIKNMAWQFATNLYTSLSIGTKSAYKALLQWSKHHLANLTQNKILQILSNARAATAYGNNIPSSLWKTDRWSREQARREAVKEQLSRATSILKAHATNNGWALQSEPDRLALRQLHNWDEGRARCGNSYWWIRYNSPGLEHLKDFGVTSWCKTGHVCSCPGCSDCALWESEKETAEWDWEGAYGEQFPILAEFSVTGDTDAKQLKQAVQKMVKRKSIQHAWGNCFGAFVPTQRGYTLQLMIRPDMLNQDWCLGEMRYKWGEVCSELFGKFGQVIIREPELPALDLAIELILKAERELFRLIDEQVVSPQTGWKWFCNWIGSKPGAKGMNRIFHGPGFRNFRLDVDGDESEELSPNIGDPLLDGISSDDEDEVDEKSEPDFPKTWFSLEKQFNKGYLFKVEDPYLNQTIYLDLGGYSLNSIPLEYINHVTQKPLAGCASSTRILGKNSGVKQGDCGLSPGDENCQTRETPAPDGFKQWQPAKQPQPVNPWATYSPEQRAREKGTFKGKKTTTLEANQFMSAETLTREQSLQVAKKIDPDYESSLLAVRLF